MRFFSLARLSMGAKIYYLYVQLPSNGPKHNSQTNGQLKNTSNYVCLWPRGFACTHRHRAHSITAARCCNTGMHTALSWPHVPLFGSELSLKAGANLQRPFDHRSRARSQFTKCWLCSVPSCFGFKCSGYHASL